MQLTMQTQIIIHFCIQAFQTNKFSRPKNKKTYLENILSVTDIQLQVK